MGNIPDIRGAVLNAGLINGSIPPGRKTGRRRLPGDFLALMAVGEASYCDHLGRKQIIKAPVVIYAPRGMPHSYDPNPRCRWKNYWMLFDKEIARHSFGDIVPSNPGVFNLKETSDIEKDWSELYAIKLSECQNAADREFLLLHKILFGIKMQILGGKSAPYTSRFEQVLRDLNNSWNVHDVDLVALARRHGLGYDNFRKQFKAELGTSPGQYFLKLKINAAKTLLLNSSLNVKQIAESVGLENQYYFSRIFKLKTGQAPSKFRHMGSSLRNQP